MTSSHQFICVPVCITSLLHLSSPAYLRGGERSARESPTKPTQPLTSCFGKPWRRGCCSGGSSRLAVCPAARAGASCSPSATVLLSRRRAVDWSAAARTDKSRRTPGSRFVPVLPIQVQFQNHRTSSSKVLELTSSPPDGKLHSCAYL